MDLLAPADWTFPVPIAFGPGRLNELAGLAVSAGMTKPLVVTDRGSAELPFIARSIDGLRAAGMQAELFAGISPNPTLADIEAGRTAFRNGGHDGVIAIGGGSGMDGGKAISLTAHNQLALTAFDYDAPETPGLAAGELVPLICVPTTAGTGAETESTAMVTDPERGVKICVWHPDHRPAAALLDPELTVGLPANLTAWTGVDALVHAIEAYSVDDWHPLCDGLAVQAIELIWKWLPAAVSDGDNLEARAAMLTGSCLAGISFLKGLGLVHAMSHMVGAVYDTHHGLTNAILLTSVLDFNEQAIADKRPVMARAMGLDAVDHASFVGSLDRLLRELEIPGTLGEIGVGTDRIAELAQKSLGDAAAGTNPRSATTSQVEELLSAAI